MHLKKEDYQDFMLRCGGNTKYYFALYLQNSPVFGVDLRGQRFALQVWFQTDVRAESNNLVLDHPYKCKFRDSDNRGKYKREVKVKNIKDVLEFAYLGHLNQNTSLIVRVNSDGRGLT